eukprot:s542_g2.t1
MRVWRSCLSRIRSRRQEELWTSQRLLGRSVEISRDDPLTWTKDSSCWRLAQNPNVAHVMAMLWRDALQVTEPEDSKDQNPWAQPGCGWIQAFACITAQTPSSGGLFCVPGFHKRWKSWGEAHPEGSVQVEGKTITRDFGQGNPFPVPLDDSLHGEVVRVCAPRGSLVLWDSRLPHQNYPNSSEDEWRVVLYMNFWPYNEQSYKAPHRKNRKNRDERDKGWTNQELTVSEDGSQKGDQEVSWLHDESEGGVLSKTVWYLIEEVLIQRPQLEAGKRITVPFPSWVNSLPNYQWSWGRGHSPNCDEQETPVLEPTSIDLHVPAYQGLRTKRKVWLGKELLQAFCPQLSITWVNFHASEVNAAVLSRLYSCFEVARQHNRRQGGFLLQQGEEDQMEITRERTGKRGVQTLRNALGTCAVIAVPDQSGERLSRMIARLPEEMGLPLEVAKRRARKVVTRVFRSRGTKQQRIAKSRSALLDVPAERKGPVRSMLPMIARAEDLVAGAGRVAKDAMKDTVKRSGEVFKELRTAAAAELVISREVDEADELERVVTTGCFMPPPLCSKCRQVAAAPGDLWCLACTAWEALGRELSGNWDLPGIRRVADDLVINTTRQVRSLRSVGAGLSIEAERERRAGSHRAPSAPHAPRDAPRSSAHSGHRSELPRHRPVPPPEPPLRRPKEERREAEDDEGSDHQEEEEEERELDPDFSGAEPKRRPPSPDPGTHSRRSPKRTERPRSAGRRRASKEHHSRRESKREDRHSRRSAKTRKPGTVRRAGRKHQRLGRLALDPFKVVHRKASAGFLELSSIARGGDALLRGP